MATVYKAYDPGTDRYVAIKIVSPQFAQHPEFQERFRREAKSIAKLEHPHIIPVHAFGQEGDTAYLVLRYMEGIAHPDPYIARLEAMLLDARGFMPDLGDTIGGDFQLAEWQAIVEVLNGADIPTALERVADAQAKTLGQR